MVNLRDINGKLKGDLGEVIFTHIQKYAHRAKFDSNYWFDTFKYEIPLIFKVFLRENWGTIDAFEFILENNKIANIIIYEIKTTKSSRKKQCLTSNSLKFYQFCQTQGYLVKSVTVIFKENWNVQINIRDFKEYNYTIWNGGYADWKKSADGSIRIEKGYAPAEIRTRTAGLEGRNHSH